MRDIIIKQVCKIRPHLTAAKLAHVSDEALLSLLSVHAARDRRRRYQARLMIDGNRVSLGYFKTPEEAHAAVEEAKFRHSIGLPLTE
jgi:hypothetical protein